ncbi:LCP family protein [Aestuariimicrobium ganziense]|uniref:LCP family protein n=1 Tax=Aestuariimicrobium ganziense TaxID=2773677 RepID=UPI001942C640|nr:LCP family protein [Aestuariimicrobium ganziense]
MPSPSSLPSLTAAQRARGVRLRRGIGYLLGSAVLPGSVQLVAGNRRLGVLGLRVVGLVWAVLLLAGVGLFVARGAVVTVATTGWILKALQPVLWVLGAGWALLLLDSLRLARPGSLGRRGGWATTLSALAVAVAVLAASIGAGNIARAQGDLFSSVLGGGGNAKQNAGRYNILLLGGDAGANRDGLRPDSIHVASVDAESGRTVLFSLPRNLEDVRFPADSPLHDLYPNGYSCDDHSCMLNAVYLLGQEHADRYPGVKDPGVQATKEAVEETLGLEINYYAMVDLAGFSSLVDALGGIRLDIGKRVPIGGGSSKIFGWIEPGRNVHLDGYHALWFARSREGSTDFERMARQKCVMSAMLHQLNPTTVLVKFNEVAAAGKQIAVTDVGPSDVNRLTELAVKARQKPIASISFTPPLVYPGNPKFDVIHATVKAAIERSEALDEGRTPATASPTPAPSSQNSQQPTTAPAPAATPTPTPRDDNGTPAPTSDDLAEVCAVS